MNTAPTHDLPVGPVPTPMPEVVDAPTSTTSASVPTTVVLEDPGAQPETPTTIVVQGPPLPEPTTTVPTSTVSTAVDIPELPYTGPQMSYPTVWLLLIAGVCALFAATFRSVPGLIAYLRHR